MVARVVHHWALAAMHSARLARLYPLPPLSNNYGALTKRRVALPRLLPCCVWLRTNLATIDLLFAQCCLHPLSLSLSWQSLICRKSSLLTLNDCSLKDSSYSDSLSFSFLLTKQSATTLIVHLPMDVLHCFQFDCSIEWALNLCRVVGDHSDDHFFLDSF